MNHEELRRRIAALPGVDPSFAPEQLAEARTSGDAQRARILRLLEEL